MNLLKLQRFFGYAVIVTIGMVLATAAAYFVLEEVVFPMKLQKPQTQETFESITHVKGMVSVVERSAGRDGAVLVLISLVGGELQKVLVPRSLEQCKTVDVIDPETISVGDVIDVKGESLEHGEVFPCKEQEHYAVKLVSETPTSAGSSSTTTATSASTSTVQ